MDTLHTVLRSINSETKSDNARPDHLTVFREFLAHLDEIQRKALTKPAAKKQRAKTTRRKSKRTK